MAKGLWVLCFDNDVQVRIAKDLPVASFDNDAQVRTAKQLQAHFTKVQKGMELARRVEKARETKQGMAARDSVEVFIKTYYNAYVI
jgi:hypothetical protein